MAELLPVPEVAAGTTEVVLAEWLVEEGTPVRAGDAVAVVETEKAVVEIEAEADAVLLRRLAAAGTAVEVGSPLALLGSAEEAGTDPEELLAGLGVRLPRAGGVTTADGPGKPAPPRRDVPDPAAATVAVADPAPTLPVRRFVSPIARRLLREAGVAAEQVEGTGPHGRIVRRDVERALAERQVAPAGPPEREPEEAPAAATGGAPYVVEEHSRLRRAVATRLTSSKQEVPHFYLRRSVVLDDLLDLRARVNEQSPVRVSVNDFVVRAVAAAHQAVPEANVVWTEQAMHRYDTVDVAVAIASARGLVTPVLRGVERSSLSAISRQVKDHAAAADAGRLRQQDLEGGTITVTNLGMYDVDEFAAIINPPHSAILAVGAARPTAVVVEGDDGPTVGVRTTAQLVLSVDHRAIDGALAARWLAALVAALESPLGLLV